MSHTTSLNTSAFARTAALTTILALGAASAAQAAAPALPARVVQPSAQYKFSHLAAFHTPVRSAATHGATSAYPLNAPDGLAVAPNGDLYVANLLANQVLVYGSNLAQKTAGTISTGLAHPSSVAFDSASEVFVSNIASNQITVYAPNHMPLTNRTITSSVNAPVSIAIDGFDNLYVDDNFAAVGLYSYTGAFLGNIRLTTTLLTLNSIAQHGHLSAFAGTNQVQSCVSAQAIDYVVHGYGFGFSYVSANDALGVAFDGNDNVYVATADPEIEVFNAATSASQVLAKLPFVPQAIAIDSVHNHISVSDLYHNAIAVYNSGGQLLTTLH